MQSIPVINFGAFPALSRPRPRLGQQEISFPEAETERLVQENAYVQGLEAGKQRTDVDAKERRYALGMFIRSGNELEQWKDDLYRDAKKILSPSVFDIADLVVMKAKHELNWLKENVWGKTGNPNAEDELGKKWKKLSDEATYKITHPPSVLTTLANAAMELLNFLLEVAKEVWNEFVSWAQIASKPVLRRYFNAEIRFIDLQNDLVQAKKSGAFTDAEIRDQETTLEDADLLMDVVRTTFSSLTGGIKPETDLDDYVQVLFNQEYPKRELGAAVGWPLFAIVGAAILGIVGIAAAFIDAIGFMAKEYPGYLIFGLVGLGVVALTLPYLFAKD